MAIAATFKEAAPGLELPDLTTAPISPLTLALFSGGSGDHNPIHLDIDLARASGFDNVFAHGMLSMAYMGRLLSDWAPPERIRSFSTRFTSITPLRSTVTCRGKIIEVFVEDGARFAKLLLTTTLADGAVTLNGEAVVLLD